MIRKISLFITIGLSIITLSVLPAQELKRKTEKLLDKSNAALANRNWKEAMAYMEQAVDSEPDNFRVHLEKAYLLYTFKNIPKMLPSLQKAFELNPEWKSKYHEFYFILGKESFEQGKYELAKAPIAKYLEKGYNKNSLALSEIISQSIDFAREALADYNAQEYNIQKLNSQQIFRSVYFPFFTLFPEENLYFTAQRINSLEEGIYRAELNNEQFSKVEEVPVINSDQNNEGAAAVSADGRVMVFTSCNRRDGLGSCDLYVSYKDNNQWTEPINMGESINTRAWESQPYLSSDGRLLVFSSNRSGGSGKRDLYFATKNIDGAWQKTKNLGSSINTFADEISPFLSLNEDTLYFSSNGRVGMGGFDFYKVDWETKNEPINVGLPFNSFQDEISYHQKLDGDIYWARELKSDDKYPPAEILFVEKTNSITDSLLLVYGTVTSEVDKKPLAANIQIFDLRTDSLLRQTASDALTGSYKVLIPYKSDYSFYVEAEGYLFNSLRVGEIETSRHEQNFELQEIKKGNSISLNNIYFEFDSYSLDGRSKKEIEKLAQFLKANAQVKIEIAGYTDNIGSANYNLELSRKRAEAVYRELLKQTVLKSNITYKGYGAVAQPNGEFQKIVKINIIDY